MIKNELNDGTLNSLSIKKFELYHSTIIFGDTQNEKTSFIINKIYGDLCYELDELFVISDKENSDYYKITDKIFKYGDLSSILSTIKNERNNGFQKNIMPIIDSEFQLCDIFNEITYKGRHYGITLVVSSYFRYGFNIGLCANIDNVVITSCQCISQQKRLYEYFFGHINDFSTFRNLIKNKENNVNLLFNNVTKSINYIPTLNNNDKILISNNDKILISNNYKLINVDCEDTFIKKTQNKISNIINELVELRNELKKYNINKLNESNETKIVNNIDDS